MRFTPAVAPIALMALAGLAPLSATAQVGVRFQENFDSSPNTTSPSGPASLTANGWIFRNQSANRTATFWRIGDWLSESVTPTTGSRMLAANANWDNGTRIVSSWAILPPVAGQQAGDTIQYVISGWAYSDNQIELRYSPTGGTSTGSGTADVGDFTQLLTSTPLTPNTWTPVSVTLPGSGRIALRWVNPQVTTYQSPSVMVDTLSITANPIDPPLPQNGQSVTWTTAMSPITIRANTTIPAGGTVNVQPGVTINVQNNATLTVSGTLNLPGTQAAPITINHASNYPPAITVLGGTLNAAHTTWTGQLRPYAGGNVTIADSTFTGPKGLIWSDLYSGTAFLSMSRTTFNNSQFIISNHTLKLDDVTLNNSQGWFLRNYAFMRNLAVNGNSLDVDGHWQGTYLHDLSITGNTAGRGLGLGDANFHIAPSVTIQGNLYPIELAGGILPGSVLPSNGNTRNYIRVATGDQSGENTWAAAGLPYYVPSFRTQFGGSLTILPGVEVQLDPNAGMINQVGEARVMGTPELPVLFHQFLPGEKWYPLQNFSRFRHAILDGARTGAAWPSQLGWGFMDSSIVRNCDLGVGGQAIVRKTQFLNNGIGADVGMTADLNGETNPNAFEGNGRGVQDAVDARFNWWGSPDGPFGGDTVEAGVPFEPFRTERPNYDDAPPLVELEKHSFLAQPGQTFILTWKAQDDVSIVSQRVLMSLDGDIVQGNLSEPVITLADNLAGDVRSLEFVMPSPVSRFFGSSNIRIESTDTLGQVGWDDLHIRVQQVTPNPISVASPTATTATAGDNLGDVCYSSSDGSGGLLSAYLHLENTDQWMSLGGSTTNCLSLELFAPFVSTDRAQVVISEPAWAVGPYITIRPDARVGDPAPTVTLTSPAPGSTYTGGQVVPIEWTASDNDPLRAFHLQVSTDQGLTWNFIARDLPGNATSYPWQLPDSQGIPDLRLKVVAVDLNFQDTSALAAVTITPGIRAVACSADFNADGDVGTDQDIEAFFACLGGHCCPTCGSADFNHDGDVATDQDIESFFRVLGGGSC